MNKKLLHMASLAALVLSFGTAAQAAPLAKLGITVGSLGNPYFVAAAKGAAAEAKKLNPKVQVTTTASDYDLNKQFTQMDNFVAAGDSLILLNAADPVAILPAVKKAQAAHVPVVAFDVAAQGANATIMTDNVRAGYIACEYMAKRLKGKGNVVIINGPQVSAVTDRVKGCKQVLAKNPGLKLLSDNLDAKGSRDGGFAMMQGLLTRFPHIDGVFGINDPTSIGAELAAKQLHRSEMIIVSVDGSPDIEQALKAKGSLIVADATQDPYTMAARAVAMGNKLLQGKKLAHKVVLMQPHLITAANVAQYKGWTSH